MNDQFNIYIPARNEEIDIEKTINEIRKVTKDKIIVIDNASEDNTSEISKKYSDEVVFENKKGKGNVVKKIIEEAKSDFIFMTDGDNTYDVTNYESHKKYMMDNSLDMIVGKRIYDKKYIKRLDRKIANRIFNFIFKILIGGNFSDICSGYRFIRLDKFKNLNIESTQFEIETEINIFSVLNNLKVQEYQIHYRERVLSKSKLKSFEDSSKILYFLISKSFKYFPLRFFLFFASVIILISIIINFLLLIL